MWAIKKKKKKAARQDSVQAGVGNKKKGGVSRQVPQHECMALHRSAVLGAQHLGWAGGLMV